MYHQYRILSKQHDRLKKIAASAEQAGVVVDKETHADLVTISSESRQFFEEYPPDSFQHIFRQWRQLLRKMHELCAGIL